MVNQTNEEVPDGILERIRNILAYTKSDNEHEAATAAAKAQELLLKYNLEMSDIILAADGEKEIPIISSVNWIRFPKKWRSHLIHEVGLTYFCRVLWLGRTKGYTLIGRKHNVEIAREVFQWIDDQIHIIAEAKRRELRQNQTWRDAFKVGASMVVIGRLQDHRYQQRKAMQEEGNTAALAVIADKAVDEYVVRKHPNVRGIDMNMGSVGSYSGYNAGRAAGADINIGPRSKSVGGPKGLLKEG